MAALGYSAFSIVLIFFMLKEISCSNRSPRVVIVGAGAAGIAAAAKLIENNITNIKILEAKNRLGGRIHSVKFGDAMIDLGAQWCYGEKNNSVYELVREYDILEPGEQMITLYHSSHDELDVTLENELYSMFHHLYTKDIHGSEISLGEYIIKEYNDTVVSKYGKDKDQLEFASEFLRFLVKAVLIHEGSFSVYDVAAKSDFKKCESNCGSMFKGTGFKIVLDILMKKYPNLKEQLPIDGKILFNKEVAKVIWDINDEYDEAPFVQCLDGTIYKADHIIFTPSLGVLKYNYGTLFTPPLPERKINAVKDIGIASIFKVFLHYPIRWWPSSNFSDFSFLWAEKDRQLILQDIMDESSETLGNTGSRCCNSSSQHYVWLLDLIAVYAVPENPYVLEAIFCGESVPKIEKCSDEALADGIMFVLNKFVGFYLDNITKPDAVIRQNWYTDPHFRGAFSFQTVQSRKKGISQESILGEPVLSSFGKYTLLFAGEATHPYYYSTVNGAIETGHREAERIINFYKQNESEKEKNSTKRL